MIFLTDSEIIELTGQKQRAAQVRALRSMGVPHRVRPDGKPIILRADMEAMSENEKLLSEQAKYAKYDHLIAKAKKRHNDCMEMLQLRAKARMILPEKTREPSKEELERIEEETRQLQAIAKAERRAMICYHANKRRAKRLQQTPLWADQEAIREIYKKAAKLSQSTRKKHHVDHVIPLQGTTVSGLHVESNLRVVPASVNLKKYNHWHENT